MVWDEQSLNKVRGLRAAALPSETGGVLLGYFDLKMGRVYVVDALAAPADSHGDPAGFTRGVEGLLDAVRQAQERTRDMVTYIGEWHSHPPYASVEPSVADLYLLEYLAAELQRDGYPALMLIVGEGDEEWLVGQQIVGE